MAVEEIVTKRVAISKSNAQIVIVVAVASFVTIFCLIAAKSVWSENAYQGRVISAEDTANAQLQSNLNTYDGLAAHFNSFVSNSTNVLGGQSSSTNNNGGNNAKIILDALPPNYDFPSLASSIEGILKSQGVDITDISGTDNELTQQNNTSNPNPAPVQMAVSFTVNNVDYQEIGNILSSLQKSVRPIAVDNITLSGGGSSITLNVSAHTFYQPAKSLGITEQEVK